MLPVATQAMIEERKLEAKYESNLQSKIPHFNHLPQASAFLPLLYYSLQNKYLSSNTWYKWPGEQSQSALQTQLSDTAFSRNTQQKIFPFISQFISLEKDKKVQKFFSIRKI